MTVDHYEMADLLLVILSYWQVQISTTLPLRSAEETGSTTALCETGSTCQYICKTTSPKPTFHR